MLSHGSLLSQPAISSLARYHLILLLVENPCLVSTHTRKPISFPICAFTPFVCTENEYAFAFLIKNQRSNSHTDLDFVTEPEFVFFCLFINLFLFFFLPNISPCAFQILNYFNLCTVLTLKKQKDIFFLQIFLLSKLFLWNSAIFLLWVTLISRVSWFWHFPPSFVCHSRDVMSIATEKVADFVETLFLNIYNNPLPFFVLKRRKEKNCESFSASIFSSKLAANKKKQIQNTIEFSVKVNT